MKELILNLIELSKSNDDLVAQLVTGMIDEYVGLNGEVKFKDRFSVINYGFEHKVEYILYSSKNKMYGWYDGIFKYSWNLKEYGVEKDYAFISDSQLKLFKSNPLTWYKRYLNPKYNGRILVKYVNKFPMLINKRRNPHLILSRSTMKDFKLETDKYYNYDIDGTSFQAIIYIKYKRSRHNPLIKEALRNTNNPPSKGKYIYLMKFRIESIEQGERLLLYLHHFIKDLI